MGVRRARRKQARIRKKSGLCGREGKKHEDYNGQYFFSFFIFPNCWLIFTIL
jgi:hypothetical protein